MNLIKGRDIPECTKLLLGALALISITIVIVKINTLQQLAHKAASNSTPLTLNISQINVPVLQLIPESAIKFPWVFITAIFAEVSYFGFIFSAIVLSVGSTYVDRFWGSSETIKFVLLVGTITNFITVVVTILCNMVRGDVSNMKTPLGGGLPYYVGFLVVLKQLIPEHKISLFNKLVNFKAKHLPLGLLAAALVWSLVISRSLYPFVPAFNSFLVSFIYLRFFQTLSNESILPTSNQQTVSTAGDASDTFKLVEFFPEIAKAGLEPVFDKIYEVAVLLSVVPSFTEELIEQSNARARKRQETAQQGLGSSNSVAERRRQVALQVIEEKISKDAQN